MQSKLLLATLIFAMCVGSVNGQATFQKTYGGANIDDAYSVQQTTDGGFIAAGTTTSIGAGLGDVFLLKTNATGDTVFTKSYGGSDNESGYAVQQTTDGGYIVSGSTTSFGAGLWDIYLIKTNSLGDTVWTKTFGGTNQDYGYDVQQTSDGGYIVAGIRNSPTTQFNDVYLIKTDANGDTLWTKTYGGSNHDEGYAVRQTTDGGYIIAGFTVTFGAGNADVYLIKTNASGDITWTKTYGGTDADYCYAVQQTTDGGYIVGCQTLSFGTGNWDAMLIKTDANGDMLWSKTYGGVSVDYAHSVQQTTDGGFVLGGSTLNFGAGNYDMYLIKTNSTGDTLWTKTYGGAIEDMGYYAMQTSDGGYIVAGYSVTFGVGSLNVYLVKTDANGNTDCNQHNTATVVTIPALQVSNTATTIANPAAIESHTATATHSGGTVSILCFNSGTNEIKSQNNSINIYPNPADEFADFNLLSADFKYAELRVFDLMGRIVYSAHVTTPNFKLATRDFLTGIYSVQLTSDEKTFTEKLIISH